MIKTLGRYQQIRFTRAVSRLTRTDYLMIVLLILALYLIGQLTAAVVGVNSRWSSLIGLESLESVITIVNIALLIGSSLMFGYLIWRRLPYLLAIGVFGGLILYLISVPTFVVVIGRTIVEPQLLPRLLALTLGLGLLGTMSALVELTKRSSDDRSQGRFWLNFSRRQSFPSFTGMGSLFITGVNRIFRDRSFVAVLSLYLVVLLATSVGWSSSTGTFGDIGGPYLIGMLILVLVEANSLADFSVSLLKKFPGLPVSGGAIDLAVSASGLAALAVINWVILFGLRRLNFEEVVGLTGVVSVGFVLAFLLSRSWRPAKLSAGLGRWWLIISQIIALGGTYQILAQLTVFGIMMTLLICLAILVLLTSYQETSR